MQQPNSNKVNTIMVAASSTQVDVGRNAGRTHAGHMPGIYTHGTLAVLAVSDISAAVLRRVWHTPNIMMHFHVT
jgi:hypothetical protein